MVSLRSELVDLIDRDAAAYDLVVAAYKLPKATDDEKAARKAAVARAMRVATAMEGAGADLAIVSLPKTEPPSIVERIAAALG